MQKDYFQKKVLILGAARTGVSAARLLKKMGADILVADKKGREESGFKDDPLIKEIPFKMDDDLSALEGISVVITSPGVPADHMLIKAARDKGIAVITEVEFASEFIRSRIVAITGTNGKTTTCNLTAKILEGAYGDVGLGGNVGIPLSHLVDEGKGKDFIVAEISTFQLEWIESFKPYIATVLNISPDHLDRHKDMDEYIGLKMRIHKYQDENDYAVINLDDPILPKLTENGIRAKKVYFSRKNRVSKGAFLKGDRITLIFDGREEDICSTDELKIRGVPNIENVLAASCICKICGVSAPVIRERLMKFEGIEHRMEFVRELKGVTFINDSKATNVGAVEKAIEGISSPIVLIAGGLDKGNDYSSIKGMIEKKVRTLVLIGDSRDKLKKAFSGVRNIVISESMERAVKAAYSSAEAGDVVILSPACASFDMFKNYEDRGRVFKEAVKKLNGK